MKKKHKPKNETNLNNITGIEESMNMHTEMKTQKRKKKERKNSADDSVEKCIDSHHLYHDARLSSVDTPPSPRSSKDKRKRQVTLTEQSCYSRDEYNPTPKKRKSVKNEQI